MATEDEVFGGERLNGAKGLGDYFLDWNKLYGADDAEPVRWIAEPVLAEGRGHALYAPAKVGKSLLALSIAAAVATGRPLFGGPRTKPVPVVYVDYEMTPEDVLERLEAFGYLDPAELDLLFYAMLPDIGALDGDAGGKAVVDAAIEVDAGLVVIDTTGRAVGGSENDSDTYLGFYRYTGRRLKAEGIGWLRLDHAGKDVAKGQRGTSAKNDDVDVVWYLEAIDTPKVGGRTPYRLTATHRRMGWVARRIDLELVDPDDDDLAWVLANPDVADPPRTGEVLEALDELDVPLDLPIRKTKTLLRSKGIKANTDAIQRAIRYRRDRGLVPTQPTLPADDDDGGAF